MATVLIVDDRGTNVRLLAKLLSYEGHRCVEARDGLEALTVVKTDPPDLIITDLHMPKMGGIEMVNALRVDRSIRRVPVILYSATFSLREAEVLKKRYGVEAVLPKPTEPEQLLATVRELLSDTGIRAAAPAGGRTTTPEERDFPASRHLAQLELEMSRTAQATTSARAEHAIGDPEEVRDSIALRLTALVEVGLTCSGLRDADALLAYACDSARSLCSAQYAAIGIVDTRQSRLVRFASLGFANEDRTALRAQLPAFAPLRTLLDTDEIFKWSSAERWSSLQFPAAHPKVESLLAVGLASKNQTFGWIYVANSTLGPTFTDVDARILGTIAAQLAIAYDNVVMTQGLERTIRARSLMAECNRILADSISEQEMDDRMCRAVVEKGGYDGIRIEHTRGDRVIQASAGATDDGPVLQLQLNDGTLPFGTLGIFSSHGPLDGADTDVLQELSKDVAAGLLALETDFARREIEREWGSDEHPGGGPLAAHESVVWSARGFELSDFSSAIERVYGRTSVEFRADPTLWRKAIYPADRATADAATSAADANWKTHEYRITRPKGDVRWISERVRSLPDRAGHERLEGTITDITDRRQAAASAAAGKRGTNASLIRRSEEVRLIQAGIDRHNEELVAIDDAFTGISSALSHDLSAPLNQIIALGSTLDRDFAQALDGEGNRLVGDILDEAGSMAKLVDDVLVYSDVQHRELAPADIDVTALAAEVFKQLLETWPRTAGALEAPVSDPSFMQRFSNAMKRSPAAVAPSAAVMGERKTVRPKLVLETLPTVWADRSLIKRVLENLISNAIKHSAKSPDPTITVTGSREGGSAVFEVRDNGAGFDMAKYDDLFRPLKPVHTADEFPGKGIGLAVARRIIERHHGRIWAHGLPGEGATFSFALPATRSAFSENDAADQPYHIALKRYAGGVATRPATTTRSNYSW